MPTESPSSIQKPPVSRRDRTNADTSTSATRSAGTGIRCDSTARHGRASWTLVTAAKLPGRSGRKRRPEARHDSPPILLVHDVDGVVATVGPGDTEEEARPPPEAESALARELAPEDQRPPELLEVDAALLRDAVDEHLELVPHCRGQLHLTPRFHPLYDATRRAPDRFCHSWYEPDRPFGGRNRVRRQRRLPARRGTLAERAPRAPGVRVRGDLHRHHPRRRRGCAHHVRREIPPGQARAHGRGA